MNRTKNRLLIKWSMVLFAFWMGVSGKFLTHEVILAALVITCVVAVLGRTMPMNIREGSKTVNGAASIKNAMLYVFYMVSDIVSANLHVARIVLSPGMRINPGMVEYEHGLKERFAGFLYANSITLTPGTLTVLMDKDDITVHLLELEQESGLRDWKVAGVIRRMEDGE